MSSSRIIKCRLLETPPTGFLYETLQHETLLRPVEAGEGFQPLLTEGGRMSSESVLLNNNRPAAAGDSPAVRTEADEAELQQQIQDAFDNGFADGRREVEESVAAVSRALSEAITAVSSLREQLIRECEDDLLRLAMMVAKQIIRQEISLDRKILAQFVCEATTGIAEQNDIVICFNPEDYQLVAANRNLYLAGIGDKIQVTIKPDESISVGGCIVETQTGLVDASVEHQLATVFKRLMEEHGHGSDESFESMDDARLNLSEQYGVKKYASQQHKSQ